MPFMMQLRKVDSQALVKLTTHDQYMKMRHIHRGSSVAILGPGALILSLIFCEQAQAQQNFAIDVNLGQSTGLTSYQRNVVYATSATEPDPERPGETLLEPFLADENNTWGTHIAMRFHVNDLLLELNAQWHPRTQYILHHESNELISSTERRPVGSYDDGGITYTPLDETRTVPAIERNRGTLLIASLAGGWQYTALSIEPVELVIPITAGLAIAHINEPSQPYRFGIKLSAGPYLSYRFAENFALGGGLKLSGVATSQYKNKEDAYRRAQIRNETTLQTITSSMIQTTFEFGLTFIVR